MEIKHSQHLIQGMQQDLGEAVFNPKFSFENHNLRITTSDSNSLLTIENEKGTKLSELSLYKFLNKITLDYDTAASAWYIQLEYPANTTLDIKYKLNNIEYSISLNKGASRVNIPNSNNIIEPTIISVTPDQDEYYYYSQTESYKPSTFSYFEGVCIGKAVINKSIVLFTHGEDFDRIYRVDDLQKVYLLYKGHLNFSLDYLIETISYYDSSSTQKVYWIDGLNSIRAISINSIIDPNIWDSEGIFNFRTDFEAFSFIDVTKNDSGGEFAPGSIQYAYTYITEDQGIETNIVNTSGLHYISFPDRGAKKDETCYNSFSLKITGLDRRFKYVRVYSIHRTSLDSTPTVKVLGEFEIQTPSYIKSKGLSAFKNYWDLRSEFINFIKDINIVDYTSLRFSDPFTKYSNSYPNLVSEILAKFGVNIAELGNGVVTLQEIFTYIWKQLSYFVNITDTGVVGTNEDPSSLLYKNSSNAIVTTFASKDSTLFIGGYKLNQDNQSELETIKLNKSAKETLVGIKVVPIEERHDTLWSFSAFVLPEYLEVLNNGVASDITIKILVEGNDSPIITKIFKGNTIATEEGKYTGTTPTFTAEIITSNNSEYYSDDYYTYFIPEFQAKPIQLILQNSDGISEWDYRDYVKIEDNTSISTYTYRPFILNSSTTYCKQFKKGQPYRFALQGQFSDGHWGDPILLETIDSCVTVEEDDESDSLIEVNQDTSTKSYNQECPLSFIVDPVLDSDTTPQNTLQDIYITKGANSYYSNLVYNKEGSVIPNDISYNVFNPGKPSNSFFYIPSGAYNDSSAQDINKTESFDWTGAAAPWKYIYNKDSFYTKFKDEYVNIQDVSPYIEVKQNYTVDGKSTKSMWLGSLDMPQSSTELWNRNNNTFPTTDLGTTLDISNASFSPNQTCLYLNRFKVTLSASKVAELYNKGYRRVRLLYVIPSKVNRKYPAQGILTNSIFIPKLRATNSCWAYTDYLARPREVYRVWNEKTRFFNNWSTKIGLNRQIEIGIISPFPQGKLFEVKRLIANPYFYPILHRFITDYENSSASTDGDFNKVWNIRPNYGHLMTSYRELLGPYSLLEKNYYPTNNKENYFKGTGWYEDSSKTNGFAYNPNDQTYSPKLYLEDSLTSNINNYITFDDSIVDFWSPDVEYQESDKNYFENSVVGIKLRALSHVVSTTNSVYSTGTKGSTFGVLGYSNTSNYNSFITLDSIRSKGFNSSLYSELTSKWDINKDTSTRAYLAPTNIFDVGSSVHRLVLNGAGNWNINKTDCKWPFVWDNIGTGETSDVETFSSKIFSFKSYCLNTLNLKDLKQFEYLINTPTYLLKDSNTNTVSLYKTGITGEDVLYKSGMDELILKYSDSKITANIPIEYQGNNHLTFSFKKGDLATLNSNSNYTLDTDTGYEALPVMPEFTAWAKYHDNKKIIGSTNKKLILVKLCWWPSKNSSRPQQYLDEPYSVSDSWKSNDGGAVWKVALESTEPLPIDLKVNFTYRLGFWKDSTQSKKGSSSITIGEGSKSSLKKFKHSWTSFRNWSTINVLDWNIDYSGSPKWTKQGDSVLIGEDQVIVLVKNQTYLSNTEFEDSEGNLIATDPWYIDPKTTYVEDLFDPIQGETLSEEYNNVGIDSIIYHRNLPYFMLVDLERSDEFIYSDWAGSGIYNQIWTPCGEPTILTPPELNESCIVYATEGDVFVGRYDCLRVTSKEESKQKVNNIVSFICESYTNPDGRSDVNRYTTDTRYLNFDNFNLYNSVYSQTNNFFSYNKNDYRVLEATGDFNNQFAWSLPKSPNMLTDPWTNITFSSTYNLSGEYGKLTKLISYNNQLYAFQDNAIANILYNSRVQVPVSDGLPIELANSNKVDGIRYITTNIGCQNKWSLLSTNKGIYFIDNNRTKLFKMSSDGFKDITQSKGMQSWANSNFYPTNETTSLNQSILSNWMLSSDLIKEDLYIHNSKKCLLFSESLDAFTTFLDYENIPFIFNWDNLLLSIYNKENKSYLYINQVGEYNKFYDYPKSTFSIEYLINPEFYRDKIFNNIEFRGDLFSKDSEGNYTKYSPYKTLNKIRVYNEFQDSGETDLVIYKNLKKKFRIWRAFIPRDASEYKLNRIRNPWIKLKLSYIPTEEDLKISYHDLIVNYTV